MYDVVLFGGTDEGHKIADFLKDEGINYVVCVATEYGSEVIENENVIVGRMDDKEMSDFFIKNSVKLVIDATHPYAENVTENIKKSCKCKYIRVIRDEKKAQGHHFDSVKSAVSFLKKTEGKILITTGSKEIKEFSCIADRCFARVLPCEESIKLCRSAGFRMSNIICMQGPFSKDFNSAIIKETGVKYLVTKNSGKSGGFDEKVQAVKECGAELIIIDRPRTESGVTVDECKKLILENH